MSAAVGRVFRPRFDAVTGPLESITDERFEAAFERPFRQLLDELSAARAEGVRRMVVVVPTMAMSGGAQHAATAMCAEAMRVLVKGAARIWGREGITVNVVAVDPAAALGGPVAAGPVSLAPPALASSDPAAVIEFLCSEAAGDVTGQTIVVDGGLWM